MANEPRPDIGSTILIHKPDFDILLTHLKEEGYQIIGPKIKNDSLVYEPIESLADFPQGFVTEQAPGQFRLKPGGHSRFFDFIPGAHSWKQFLFPPRVELFKLHKTGQNWQLQEQQIQNPKYAFIGVRSCELEAIQIQDNVFMRSDFRDPIYQSRRERAFILSVNCIHPAGTCFCASMGTGPRVKSGYDLNLTELDDFFVLSVGSELARGILAGIPYEYASGFILSSVDHVMERSAHEMERSLDTTDLPELILGNLDNPYWHEIGKRCLSCANCTQVCPTCFCWDATDQMTLDGETTSRERIWDSCFNPGYSYQAGGNTRPSIHSRYRQWLSHKLGTWKQQYDTFGCVGCGRCITWCPVEIDLTQEISNLRMEVGK
jgi:ferredoxin